ncbi:Uncharacterised protein [BD1-7 clade bacterium]|uniref:Potassium channel domain-containing protein n=1 Tax=BD1-7 clade bacterium TaxID=2029982 RepID=A0A5S9PA36_9GAMM|nr:Uncharacterised protein [BD1-7 clade bacterium]CAA0115847.1 Uncharacterised protein [BD1-7 clade bacterium]
MISFIHEASFNGQLILGTLIVLFTVMIHVTALVLLVKLLKYLNVRFRTAWMVTKYSAIFSSTVVIILLVHTAEAWAWAVVYIHLEQFESIERALYFSVVTATTLGYGDITLSPEWQILSTFEAMGGLILFGTSTAFMMAVIQSVVNDDDSTDS